MKNRLAPLITTVAMFLLINATPVISAPSGLTLKGCRADIEVIGATSTPEQAAQQRAAFSHWALGRAQYLRELDNENLNSSSATKNYPAKVQIVEARFNTRVARSDLETGSSVAKVVEELHLVRDNLARALTLASGQEASAVVDIRQELELLTDRINHGEPCWDVKLINDFDRLQGHLGDAILLKN